MKFEHIFHFIEWHCPDEKDGNYVGNTLLSPDFIERDLPPSFREVTEWRKETKRKWGGKKLRKVWISESELAKVEFNDGAIQVTIYDDQEEMRRCCEADDAFYKVY